MKIAFEIDVPQGDSIGATVNELAEHIGRTLSACRAFGVRPPTCVAVPREFYFEAAMTCARPSHGPESWLEVLLATVPELQAIRIADPERSDPEAHVRMRRMVQVPARIKSWDP